MRRIVKIVSAIVLIYIILRVRPKMPERRKARIGLPQVSLLDQPVDKDFNRERVWVSISFCYADKVGPKLNSFAVIQSILATRLWHERTGANVVLQVHNDTEISGKDIERLSLVEKHGAHLVLAEASDAPLCDCALGHSIGRALLHTIPKLEEKLKNDSIVMVANIGGFLSKGELLNVLKSGHNTWMFNGEAIFYGHQPFPTNFVAMTVEKWKTITYNSRSCEELVQKDSHIRKDYEPNWVVKKNAANESSVIDTKDIDIMMAVVAMERFITRRALLLRHCTIPDWNRAWAELEAEAGFDPNFFDRSTCWKGMGMASCSNKLGYWYYPGMPGCRWWVENFPQEVFDSLFKSSDPLSKMVKETSILFKSS